MLWTFNLLPQRQIWTFHGFLTDCNKGSYAEEVFPMNVVKCVETGEGIQSMSNLVLQADLGC